MSAGAILLSGPLDLEGTVPPPFPADREGLLRCGFLENLFV